MFVHPAGESDNADGIRLLVGLAAVCVRLGLIWVDQGYKATFVAWIEVVQKSAEQRGLVVEPKRWIVERSIAWLARPRRLSKADECWEAKSAASVYLASSHLLVHRPPHEFLNAL